MLVTEWIEAKTVRCPLLLNHIPVVRLQFKVLLCSFVENIEHVFRVLNQFGFPASEKYIIKIKNCFKNQCFLFFYFYEALQTIVNNFYVYVWYFIAGSN